VQSGTKDDVLPLEKIAVDIAHGRSAVTGKDTLTAVTDLDRCTWVSASYLTHKIFSHKVIAVTA
jgi:hypothetical protein